MYPVTITNKKRDSDVENNFFTILITKYNIMSLSADMGRVVYSHKVT